MDNLTQLSFGVALLDEQGVIRDCNERFLCMLDLPAAEVYNTPVQQLIDEIGDIPSDQPHAFCKLMRPSGQALAVDLIRLAEQPRPRYALFCRDLTKYHQYKNEVARKEKLIHLYHQMFNALYDGIFIADRDGVCLYVNDAFLGLAGTTADKVIGKTVYQLVEDKIVSNSCVAAVLKTGNPACTINRYYQGKTCLVSGTPVFADGELTRVIAIIRDLTELNGLQEKLATAQSLSISFSRQLQEIEIKSRLQEIFFSQSPAMKLIFEQAIKIAGVDATVLLLGETGTGKDFLAKFIHDVSERGKEGHFVKVNCGAIPETLLESELFGYLPGAFTGAQKQGKAGLLQVADKGTLFLDEIGEMPYPLQVKMLNALQDKKIYRLGGTQEIELKARIIAATNADLEKKVADGTFRKDLYHRLNVITIRIPPLRERFDDILPLAMNFLDEFNGKYKKACYFSSAILDLFLAYEWPGNIRELRNLVERFVIMSDHDCIEGSVFLRYAKIKKTWHTDAYHQVGDDPRPPKNLSLRQRLEQCEKDCLREALTRAATLQDAAKTLGVDVSTLVRKKQKYNLTETQKRR